jgi:hypothetical protein
MIEPERKRRSLISCEPSERWPRACRHCGNPLKERRSARTIRARTDPRPISPIQADNEHMRRDYGEWVFGLAELAAAKEPLVPLEVIWRLCCAAVAALRPDLERTVDIRSLWYVLVEWIYPRLTRARTA